MIFIPWTILPLRTFDWALQSPTAEIMISCYAIFMVFSGVFTFFVYRKANVRHFLLQICLVINGIYAVAGTAAFLMVVLPRLNLF